MTVASSESPRRWISLAVLVLQAPFITQAVAFHNHGRSNRIANTNSRIINASRIATRMPAFLHYVDEDATADSLRDELSKSPLSLVVAAASFAPKSRALLRDVEGLEKEYDGGSCCGTAPTKPDVFVIRTDASGELEDLAIELGLKDIPGYQIYKGGSVLASSDGPSDATVDAIRDALKDAAAAGSSGCCPPGPADATAACCPPGESSAAAVACCPDGSSTADAPRDPAEVLRLVQQSYANTVNQSGGDGGCCVSVSPETLGYTQEQIIKAGKDANLGLGCGNPISFANVEKGETVVDLGSGAGVDCFLAAELVGEEGEVIGVDMTPDMVFRARQNAAKRNSRNVQFRLGEIEHLPIADNSASCVISNCVINLSPDKPQVFREIHRVLKPGGRIAISDVVIRPEKIIPERLKTAEALACCVTGAPETESLTQYLVNAGFKNVKLELKEESKAIISQWLPGSGAEDFVISAEITAKK